MSKGGHILVGATLGLAIATARGGDGLVLALVAGSAATLPDVLEIVTGFGPNGERYSLIPHRTLTHWPFIWIAIACAGMAFDHARWNGVSVGAALYGIGLGALTHCMLDIFTPTGIPILHPWTARTSIGPYRSGRRPYLYKTGHAAEWRILLPITAIAVILVIVTWSRVHTLL